MFKAKKNQETKNNNLKIIVLIICCSLAFGFVGSLIAQQFLEKMEDGTSNTQETSSIVVSSDNLSIPDVVSLVQDSTVSIETNFVSKGENMVAAGSGVIVRADGYIATNAHVVVGAQSIKVTLHNGTEYNATLVGKNEKDDIAVLKINATGLKAVTFEESDNIKVGMSVIAIGNVLGELNNSVTDGIISAINRTVTIDDNEMTLIQTDTEINHGNSGGGIFRLNGKCIGIVVAKSTGDDVEGVGFVIPSAVVKNVSDELIAKA